MDRLASELGDRPVLFLEHDVDHAAPARIDRWWAGSGAAGTVYLPLAMVSSGHAVSNGNVAFDEVYRSMVEDDLQRPPAATVEAYARRLGSTLRVYARAENRSDEELSADANDATLHVIVWEETHVADTDRFVRAASAHPLVQAVAPGGSVAVTADVQLSGVIWDRIHAVALLDYRPGGDSGPYDVLQAAPAGPPAMTASPAALELSPGPPSSTRMTATLRLAGPYSATWSAASNAPWLTVEPGTGGLPATITVTVDPALLPWGASPGALTFTASSADGLDLTTVVPVTATHDRRPIRRQLGR